MSGSQTCRGSPHGPMEKEMCHKINHSGCLLSQILFHCFVVFSFHCITPLCPYYDCSNPIMILFSVDGHHLAFYMTEHNYSVFCNQKQGSTKNVNANLSHSGNLHIFSSLASLAHYLDINNMYCTIRHKHKSIHHIVLLY